MVGVLPWMHKVSDQFEHGLGIECSFITARETLPLTGALNSAKSHLSNSGCSLKHTAVPLLFDHMETFDLGVSRCQVLLRDRFCSGKFAGSCFNVNSRHGTQLAMS